MLKTKECAHIVGML
jgi:hypothetical protein